MLSEDGIMEHDAFQYFFYKFSIITLSNHVGWFHDHSINYILWFTEQSKNAFTIHTFKPTFENLGGVILPALLT